MLLDHWARCWGVQPQALIELKQLFMAINTDSEINTVGGETELQAKIRLEAGRKGMRLFRNNVGAAYTQGGGFIRFGLVNDSAALNKKIKSSDLIGIRPVTIQSQHVGGTFGQFMAREVKKPDWKFRGTDRENAQLKFIKLITALGGDACFINRENTL